MPSQSDTLKTKISAKIDLQKKSSYYFFWHIISGTALLKYKNEIITKIIKEQFKCFHKPR
jgi:hypothetical protein